MDKKDNRSSEREPEGNSFDYEELVNEPAEDQDYEEYREEDDFDEDEEVVFRFRPWMIPVFAGMMILAILICIPLWKLSSHSGGAGDSDALVTATEAQTTEATDIPETVMAPEVSTEPISTPEPTAAPTETSQATPAATPEATIQPTEAPAATEIPNANSAGNALAEARGADVDVDATTIEEAADGFGHGGNCLFLTDHTLMQCLLQLQKSLAFLLCQLLHRDFGPLGHHLGDLIFTDA